MDTRPLLILSGTTASGKNACGVLLAEALGAEVISLDSMKVYRGMDVGTDKPSQESRSRVPHHLVDILDPLEDMNLSSYVEKAHQAATSIRERDKLPLVVGGTALYLRGFLKGVLSGPVADLGFRSALRAEAELVGSPVLHERLARVDPEAATRIHPNDYKRIERALEVFSQTGQPISALQGQWQAGSSLPHRLFILVWPREVMDRRIDERVDAMFAGAFQEEVRELRARGGLGRSASQALGYRQVLALLDSEISLSEAIESTKRGTRRFARRQLTWFRKMEGAAWIHAEEGDEPPGLADKILAAYQEALGLSR